MKMATQAKKSSIKKNWQWIMYFLFAVFSFLLIFLLFEPRLLYLRLQPFFAFDSAFSEYYFQFKQGYLGLISQFFLQFLFYPVTGSLILIVLLLLLAFVFRRIFMKTILSGFEGVEFIIPVFILWQLKNYSSGLETLFALLFAGIIFLGSTSQKQNSYLKGIYQFLTVYLVFKILGIPVAMILVLIFLLDDFIYENSLRSRVFSFACFIFLGILSFSFFGSKMLKVQLEQFSFSNMNVPFPGFWYFVFAIILTFLLIFLPEYLLQSRPKGEKTRVALIRFFPFLLLLCFAFGFKTLFINSEKYKAEIDFFAANSKWNKVLELKNKVGSQDRFARFQMNRALYGTGQLSENLFSVPQEWGEYSLFLNKEFSMDCMPYSSDLFYDLGFIKASRYWMIEYQTYAPYSPHSLQRLAISSLLLGEFATAKKYFTILSKSTIYKDYAKSSLQKLSKEPYILMKEYTPDNLSIIRGDKIINIKEPDADMLQVLKFSRKNIMAFEYLMSYYILRADLDNFYSYLPLVKSSGFYSKMPISYEEVLLIYYQETKKAVNNWEYPVSRNTIERFKEFKRTLAANASDIAKQKEMLKPMFKNTFWYYLYFDNPQKQETN
jgi:hypothetical protein